MKTLISVGTVFLATLSLSQGALVGWWNFDDGTANDSSGNGNHGTFQNGAGTSVEVANASAGTGSASFATGVAHEQHILVPHNSSLDITNAITVTAWVKPENNQWDGILAKSPSDGSGANFPGNYELRTNNGGGALEFGWEHDDAGGFTFLGASPSGVPADDWSHIAFTATSGGTYTYYIDGLSIGSGPMPANFGTELNANPLYLGNRADLSTTEFHGLLDEVALWNEELSPSQISDVFQNGVPEPSSALLALLGAAGLLARRRRA